VYGFSNELQEKYNLHDRLKSKVWQVMGEIYSALPIGVVTDTAFIVHGGLPKPNFRLDELRRISTVDRCRYATLVQPTGPIDTLLEGLLWSDPVIEPGMHPSKRGPGVQFGPDIAYEFLKREKLKYLIRAHEPVENGVKEIECGDGKSIITVFSSANYPNGEGWNYGAVLNLTSSDGAFEATQFAYDDTEGDVIEATESSYVKPFWDWAAQAEESLMVMLGGGSPYTSAFEDKLRSYAKSHQLELAQAFVAREQSNGLVTRADWATIMEDVLDLHDVSWVEIQPKVAPTIDCESSLINWREYLITTTTDIVSALADKERMGRTVDHE
jgi:diadenosine tetraphosphatase ApaH/serine/threonine PP2A family protein phosphatase